MRLQPLFFAALVTSAFVVRSHAQATPQTQADAIAAAEARVTDARPTTIAAAEAEGAAYPRATATASADKPGRSCLVVRREQIVFPSTKGRAADYRLQFGDFSGNSISFGWGDTYEKAKLPLVPRYPAVVGSGLWLRVIPMGGGAATTFETALNFSAGAPFFPTWASFPTPGKWIVIATAGANWGCFVLDRPVKGS